ncbi:acyl-CoA synthetase (AMP-forming)/AMP-acid ligase II [Leptolyngbya sp. PCC 7375]|nr:acyl-CoA synthetase (AMP-forming)/AMP-acid ligase II [Leptolyngbya sp. PCC 7375]
MITLLGKLYRTQLLTPVGLFYLLEVVLTTGVNLMALLRLAARLHPGRTAVVDERERLSYGDLWRQSENLARGLREDYGLQEGERVEIATRNHAATIKALFAVSRLGAHVFLVNPDMSTIEAATVLGMPDEAFGQRLKAVIVAKPGSMLGASAVRDCLKPRVARYQMPGVIEFQAELPYTSLGKLDKKALL